MSSWLLQRDEWTYALVAVAAGVYIALKSLEPMPLVPPLVLGRQSDASRTRLPGETAVYRNYGTGFMAAILPVRPQKDVQTVSLLVRPDEVAPRTLWGVTISNDKLRQQIATLASRLSLTVKPRTSRVLMLLNDSFEWLLTDLALASIAAPTVTLVSLNLLSDYLDQYTPSSIIVNGDFLEHLLELVAESSDKCTTIVVVGDIRTDLRRHAQQMGINLIQWADLLLDGPANESDQVRVEPSDLLTISFSRGVNNELRAVQFTHENVTASVVAAHFLLPYQNALSPKDSVVSAFSLSTSYGRSVAYSALYNGSSFTTTTSANIVTMREASAPDLADILTVVESQKAPSPTVLFITRQHLNAITKSILSVTGGGPLKPLAWRHKSYALAGGSLSNNTTFDKLVFGPARRAAMGQMGSTLRAVVVDGLDASTLPSARIALSVPIVNTYYHPLAAGPVFGSHPLDVQTFEPVDGDVIGDIGHVGAPTANIEVKLVNVGEEDGGKPFVGNLLFRGPTIGTSGTGELRSSRSQEWIETGETAAVQANGSFKILPRGL